MENVIMVFGWVDEQVTANYAAWSSWKSEGSEADADKFFQETAEGAYSQNLTWFCYEKR
jgi:hypothetical protein